MLSVLTIVIQIFSSLKFYLQSEGFGYSKKIYTTYVIGKFILIK